MSHIPEELRYTSEHEWVSEMGAGVVRVGITDHAQDALGDIVFLTLPAVGASVATGQACGEVESTKSVSDIYAPVAGVVTARNEAAETAPESLNADPYGAGWLFEVQVTSPESLADLLDADAYRGLLGQ